jgi:hypothetical protein
LFQQIGCLISKNNNTAATSSAAEVRPSHPARSPAVRYTAAAGVRMYVLLAYLLVRVYVMNRMYNY